MGSDPFLTSHGMKACGADSVLDSKSAKSCIRTSAAQEADNDLRNFLGNALVDGRDEDQNEYDYPETVYRQSAFAFATWLLFEFVFDNVMFRHTSYHFCVN